jgi:hypothetical protein
MMVIIMKMCPSEIRRTLIATFARAYKKYILNIDLSQLNKEDENKYEYKYYANN